MLSILLMTILPPTIDCNLRFINYLRKIPRLQNQITAKEITDEYEKLFNLTAIRERFFTFSPREVPVEIDVSLPILNHDEIVNEYPTVGEAICNKMRLAVGASGDFENFPRGLSSRLTINFGDDEEKTYGGSVCDLQYPLLNGLTIRLYIMNGVAVDRNCAQYFIAYDTHDPAARHPVVRILDYIDFDLLKHRISSCAFEKARAKKNSSKRNVGQFARAARTKARKMFNQKNVRAKKKMPNINVKK